MVDQLENKLPMEEAESTPVELDLPWNKKSDISRMIVGGRSFGVVVPQGSADEFLKALEELYQDEENGIPLYARSSGREIPKVKIIGRSGTDFEQRLSEFRTRKKGLLSPWRYAEEVHELNVWVNPDDLSMCDDNAATFGVMARYAQNLYLFNHSVPRRLSPQLLKALGGECDVILTIKPKKIKL